MPDVRPVLLAIGGCLLSLVAGAVVVRFGLDWADGYEYSAASELRYLLVAAVAILVAAAGSVASIVWARRRGRR